MSGQLRYPNPKWILYDPSRSNDYDPDEKIFLGSALVAGSWFFCARWWFGWWIKTGQTLRIRRTNVTWERDNG